MNPVPRLYAIVDVSFGDPVEIAKQLFDSGIRLLQIRNKDATSGVLLEQTKRIVSNAPIGCRVIVNDRADVAIMGRAHGVHLGQEDLSPTQVRKIVGEKRIIGISTHNSDQAQAAMEEPVDYVAVGPIFATSTKESHFPVVGLEGLYRICGLLDRPVVAIGGITLNNAREVLASGAASVAVISDLIGQGAIQARTRAFLEKLGESHNAG